MGKAAEYFKSCYELKELNEPNFRSKFLMIYYPSTRISNAVSSVINVPSSQGLSYVVPLMDYLNVNMLGLYFRSVYDRFHYFFFDNLDNAQLYYGNLVYAGKWNDKNYSDPVIIVEGMLDMMAVSLYYPYVLSMNSASMSHFRVKILTSFTNRFILFFDQVPDQKEHLDRVTKELNSFSASVLKVEGFKFKDPFEAFEKLNPQALDQTIKNYVDSFGGQRHDATAYQKA